MKTAKFALLLQHIVSQAMIVLKTIAGNDAVKIAIVRSNGVELILGCVNKHIRNAFVSIAQRSRITQPNFDHLVSPSKFNHLRTFYTNGRI